MTSQARLMAAALVAATLVGAPAVSATDFQTLKGHGGPIMDVTASQDTGQVASASFDNSVGLWSGITPRWLEAHRAAVNVVRFAGPGKLVSGGDDNTVILWDLGAGSHRVLEGHTAKILDLDVSPDRKWIASASWDARIGLWPVAGGAPTYISGHKAGVNAVRFSRDGTSVYSASVDGTIRQWDIESLEERRVLARNGFGVNVIEIGGNRGGFETWLAYGSQDGVTRIIDLDSGEELRDFTLERRPILALATDRAGTRLATGDGHGFITVIGTATWDIEIDFKAALKGPIWALAFSPSGDVIHAGGIENIVYSWPVEDLASFEPMTRETPQFLRKPEEMSNGERQFARKCSVCHALTADGGRKAGPTLFGLFGRRAGTLAGYNYSDTLTGSDIVWSETTVNQLFADGPDHFIPGSKMPMQRIVGPQDRLDLVEYLRRETANQTDGEKK